MARSEPTRPRRYGIAFLAVAVAGLLTFLVGKVVQPVPHLLFLTSVAVSARCGGLGPGLLATLFGALLSHVLGGPPDLEALETDPSGLYRLGLFTLLSLLISVIGENLRQAQQTLEESRHLFQSFMDHCPAFAFMKDQDGRYVYLNTPFQQAFQLSSEAWRGKTDFELWPARTAALYRSNDLRVLASGEPLEVLEPMELDGQPSYWLALRFPFRDRKGRKLLAGMAVDVTERLRLEQELQQRVEELAAADRRKDEFLAMLAHELRNPLAAISNANYVLEEARLPRARAAHLRSIISHQTQHLIRLVDDLLDVARITQGKISVRMRSVDLAQVALAAVECARPHIERRRHQLSVRLPPVPVVLHGDPDRLEQVITNLLTNASRYTDPGGRIWLAVEAEGAEARIRVRDSGAGIAPSMLDQIFEPFRQADPQSDGGMGIGLALARNLVDRHGGSICVRSEGLGRGSEFTVSLPLGKDAEDEHKEDASPPGTASPQAGAPPPSPSLAPCPRTVDPSDTRVLVVDDNTCAAETLAELLELWGFSVRTSDNGEQALILEGEWKPRIVLLDLQMPEMDGFEVARRMRARFREQPLHIIALTGCGSDVALRLREAGFDDHMLKPIEPQALRLLLHEAIVPSPRETCVAQTPVVRP